MSWARGTGSRSFWSRSGNALVGLLSGGLGILAGLWIAGRHLVGAPAPGVAVHPATTSAMVMLTLALVLITLYYAWQTRQTVHEMRESRHAQVRPHLVPFFKYGEPGVGIGAIYIVNLGQGCALDIDATMSLEPNGIVTRWRAAILRSGRRRLWTPTTQGGRRKTLHPVLAADKTSRTVVRIVGRCRDVLGTWHDFEERVPLRDDWEIMVGINSDPAVPEGKESPGPT